MSLVIYTFPNQASAADIAAKANSIPTVREDATAAATIANSDELLKMSSASANTVTIPLNATEAIPVDAIKSVLQKGAGVTTIQGATGVTVNGIEELGGGESAVAISAQYQSVALYQDAADVWTVSGAV